MADKNESEEEDEFESMQPASAKKPAYVNRTRDLSSNKSNKKLKVSSSLASTSRPMNYMKDAYDQNDEYYYEVNENDDDDDEDSENGETDLERQLRLEREEAERGKQPASDEPTKKTKKDEDGTEYEWDDDVKGWFPKIPDQTFIQYHQTYKVDESKSKSQPIQYAKPLANTFYMFNGAFFTWDFDANNWIPAKENVYSYIDYMTGVKYEWNVEASQWKPSAEQPRAAVAATVNTTAGAQTVATSSGEAKKKAITTTTTTTASGGKAGSWFDINDEKNTNVYVSGLPLDMTDEEFEEMMSKYGIIMKDPSTHKLKIKLYRDETNNEIKGDGRCCYLMPESVKLCLQLLDGSIYKDHTVRVEKAKFEMKGGAYDPTKTSDSSKFPKKKLNKAKEKKLVEKQRQRLLDWEDRPDVVRQKHEKVVVIGNLFSPAEFKSDLSLIVKLKEDIKKELETYGDVKKILIHDNNPNGIVTVSFKDVEMADECCEYLDNRVWKNGRTISCKTWDGQTKYEVDEDEEERQRRIDEWHRFIESDD